MKNVSQCLIYFSISLLIYSCSNTSNSAIQSYVYAINRMEIGIRKEQTFFYKTSFYPLRGSINESKSLFHKVENTFNTYLGSDLVIKERDRYETFYFYTKTLKRDNCATKDEMTPLIFLNGRLVGKGWNFYDSLFVKE
jgi:hypothetical protein